MQLQAKALADPSRFRLFRHIADTRRPVGVAELTELLGFNHNAIRQHLTVLRDAGLIAEATENRKVRGRPRKEYVARDDALSAFGSVSGSYEQLAKLLLEVITTSDTPYNVGRRAAVPPLPRPTDRALTDRALTDSGSVNAVNELFRQLTTSGFEPTIDGDQTVTLNHCPFADVAVDQPNIVCDLHRGLIDGMLSDRPGLVARLEPKAPHTAGCRVSFEAAADS